MAGDTFNQNHSGSGHNIVNLGPKRFEMSPQWLEVCLGQVRSLLKDGEEIKIIRVGGFPQTFSDGDRLRDFLQANGINAIDGPNFGMTDPLSAPVTYRVLGGPVAGPALLIDSEKVDPREQ